VLALAAAAVATTEVIGFGVDQKPLFVVVVLIRSQPRMRRKALIRVYLIFFGWELVHIKIVLP
jgi:hypothetical protein